MERDRRRGDVRKWLGEALHREQEECLLFPFGCGADGYGLVWMGGKMIRAHRWVCEEAHGQPPSTNHHSAHSCGNRKCVNKRHLRWASRAENEADKVVHVRSNRGERQGGSKLTTEAVLKIRAATGVQRRIAKEFGVSEQAISAIKNRRTWSWL